MARLPSGASSTKRLGSFPLGASAPADPYFAASLQLWEQGQFIRFHGMSQWVGWVWPYAAMAWLMARLAGAR